MGLSPNAQSVSPDSLIITEAKLAGYRRQYTNLKQSIKSYNDGYPSILKFERELKDFGDQLNLDKERLKQLSAVYESEVSAIHVVEKAEKTSPRPTPHITAPYILPSSKSFVKLGNS